MLRYLFILISCKICFAGKGFLCHTISQTPSVLTVTMGNKTTLCCNYDTPQMDPGLYWYRLVSNKALQLILYRDNSRSFDAHFVKERFSVRRDHARKAFHLLISAVLSEDSTTYYCAMRPQCFRVSVGLYSNCTLVYTCKYMSLYV
uniref:Ig-like domain-containing protein n=1 Tax=Terrapene triunguis TaxID=2587831 RepID=A0A674J1W7_9SAUR